MSRTVFRNYDKVAIRLLLKDIGSERYKAALADQKIDQPPLEMKGFFVEYDTLNQAVSLYYKYPSRTILFIMSVLGYWSVPQNGWERHRKDNDAI
mgnify:CR=1